MRSNHVFLYDTGVRAAEAAHLTRGTLEPGRPASVRILGKGRKMRLCPLWDHTAQVLRELLGDRLNGPAEIPVFVNVREIRTSGSEGVGANSNRLSLPLSVPPSPTRAVISYAPSRAPTLMVTSAADYSRAGRTGGAGEAGRAGGPGPAGK